jgi:hypothetical protein
MGSQIGNQKILWRYKTALIASDLATMQHGVLYPGVYGDGLVVTLSSGLDISAGELLINSVSDEEIVKIVFQDAFNIPIGAYGSGNIFVIVRFTWYDTETNYYAEVLIKDAASLLDTDVVLAVLEWNVGHTAVTAVDNSSKTYGINTSLDTVILALKPTAKFDAVRQIDVAAGNFVFSGDNVEFAGGTTASMDSSPSQRCDVIGINSSGVLVIDKGTDGYLTPNTYGAYLPVAEVIINNGQDMILQDNITDVRPYFFFGGTTAASAVSFDPAGNTYVLGTTVQQALDAVDAEFIDRDTFNERVIYFGEHGSDSNEGTSWYKPKLTLGAAITAANALTPATADWVTVRCFDSAVYTLAGNLSIGNYISVDMADAELNTGDYRLTLLGARFKARRMVKPSGSAQINENVYINNPAGVNAYLTLEEYRDDVGNSSTGSIFTASAALGDIFITIGALDVYGEGIKDRSSGTMYLNVGRAYQRRTASPERSLYISYGNTQSPESRGVFGSMAGANSVYACGIKISKTGMVFDIGAVSLYGYFYYVINNSRCFITVGVVWRGKRRCDAGSFVSLLAQKLLYVNSALYAVNNDHKQIDVDVSEIIVDRDFVIVNSLYDTLSTSYVDVNASLKVSLVAPDVGYYRLVVWVQFNYGSADSASPSWTGFYRIMDGTTQLGTPAQFLKSSANGVQYEGNGFLVLEQDVTASSVGQIFSRNIGFATSDGTHSIFIRNAHMVAMLISKNSSS